MTNIKHIFFDLDHTLWDFEKNSGLAYKQIFEKYNLSLSLSDFIKVYSPINYKYWDLFTNEKVTKAQLRYGRLKDSFDALNFVISDTLIHQIADDYLVYLPTNNYLIDNAIAVLEYLKPKYKLHIITNGFDKVQHRKINDSNLITFFDVIVTSETIGLKKPNPKVFEYALSQAQAIASESVMIGDNYQADVLGAHNVGFNVVYFKNGANSQNDDFLSIDSLTELKQYL